MVAVNDRRRIGITGVLGIALGQALEVLVVIVGVGAPIETDVAAHDGVRKRVAIALDFPVTEDEALVRLCGVNGVEHNGGRAGSGILHADGYRNAARHQTVLLVLDRACAHGNIAQQVNEVLVVGRVEHLVGGEEARFLNNAQVHMADGLDALEQVVGSLGVGVVQKTLVTGALGTRLIGVDARNDDELVLDLLGGRQNTGR